MGGLILNSCRLLFVSYSGLPDFCKFTYKQTVEIRNELILQLLRIDCLLGNTLAIQMGLVLR